MMRLQDDFFYP